MSNQNIIVALIGALGVIIGASISLLPQVFKSNNQEKFVIVEKIVEKQKERREKELQLLHKRLPKVHKSSLEDGYTASLINSIANIAEVYKGIRIESSTNVEEYKKKTDLIKSSISHEFSKSFHITRTTVVDGINVDVISDNTVLHLSSELTENYKQGIYEVNNSVLVKKPENFSLVELQHYMNKVGIYIIGSELEERNNEMNFVSTKVRYDLKLDNEKKTIEVEGYGLY